MLFFASMVSRSLSLSVSTVMFFYLLFNVILLGAWGYLIVE